MTHALIAQGAWVEQICRKKWTAMHEAAKVGNVEILMLLLRNGGRVNHRDVAGVTPLAVAAEHGHLHITEILLNCGQSEDKTAGLKTVETVNSQQCEGFICLIIIPLFTPVSIFSCANVQSLLY